MSHAHDTADQGGRSRNVLRFRLRTMLSLMIVFAVWIGWEKRNQIADEQAAAKLLQVAPESQVKWTNPFWLPLSRRTFLSRVTIIHLAEESATHRLPFEQFTRLKTISTEGDEASAARLSQRLPHVTIEWVIPEEILAEDVY